MHVLFFYALSSSTCSFTSLPLTRSLKIVSIFIFPSFFSFHPLLHQPSELELMRMTQKSEQTGIPFDSSTLRFLVVTGLRSSLLSFFPSQTIMKLSFSWLWNIASPPCCRPKAPPSKCKCTKFPAAYPSSSLIFEPPVPSSIFQCQPLLFSSQALPQPSPLLLGTIP